MARISEKTLFFLRAQDRRVQCELFGGYSWEDWPEQVADFKKKCKALNVPSAAIKVTTNKITVKMGTGLERHIMRSKIKRVRIGTLTHTPERYTFTDGASRLASHGDKKALQVVGDTLQLSTHQGTTLVYSVIGD